MLGVPNLAHAADPKGDCMAKYYVAKPDDCIQTIVALVRATPASKPVSPAAVGFLGEVFRANPAVRARLLETNDTRDVSAVFMTALHLAGLKDDAVAYAKVKGLPQAPQAAEYSLVKYKPGTYPGDNDMFIGAYMASGNKEYIRKIFANFDSAEDGMVADALRISIVQGKFGARMAPSGHTSAIVKNACAKYSCTTNKIAMSRVLTLSSAYWAMQSLSRSDEGIKQVFENYIAGSPKFKEILSREQTAVSNYLTTLLAAAATKDNANINESLAIFERLGSAKDAVDAMTKKN